MKYHACSKYNFLQAKRMLLILLSPAILFLTACPEPTPTVPSGKVNMEINGHNWAATGIEASEYSNNFGRTYYVRATNESDKWINITFYGLSGAGSYPITNNNNGPTGSGFAMVTYYSNYAEDPADTGQISVTSVTGNTVVGTFSFSTVAGVQVTSGVLNVSHN